MGLKGAEIEIFDDRIPKSSPKNPFDSGEDYIAVLLNSKVLAIERLLDTQRSEQRQCFAELKNSENDVQAVDT
jgi:hypothetical protein